MRVAFMGTPEFAVPSLEALLNAGYEVVGAFTQPTAPWAGATGWPLAR